MGASRCPYPYYPVQLNASPLQMQVAIDTEALIIGAGPIGLFQAFELGLLGVDCHIVEALDRPGGQCTELYPDKPIYDIPGTAYTTAEDFIQQLLAQIKPFGTEIHTGQTVESLTRNDNGDYVATTETGSVFTAKKIFLATGAGAFTPVKLRVDGIEQFNNKQVHYRSLEKQQLAGNNVVIVGDNNTAVQCAIDACDHAKSVVLLHRKRRLDATTESLAVLEQLVANHRIEQIKGKITSYTGNSSLQKIAIQKSTDHTQEYDVDQLIVKLGNSPKQSDLDSWGVATTARHIPVDTAHYQSELPGVFAVGDINIYPAKRKLILCGFHEATLAAFSATASLRPEKPLHLQYTTTSTELQKRLGIT